MHNDEFVLSKQGSASIPKLPHLRKAIVSEQETDVDEFGLKTTQDFVACTLPGLDPNKVELHMRCLYQNTPDLNMILGLVTEDIAVMCGFSGSGFQFAPAIALYMADLVLQEEEKARNRSFLRHNAQKPDSEAFDLFAEMKKKFDPSRFAGQGNEALP